MAASPQTDWRLPTVVLGMRIGMPPWAPLTLHRLASLSMINRETSLYPVSPPITSRAQPLACSNDSHLLAGLAKHSAQQGCSSEPPLLPNHPLLEVTALDLHFPTDRPSKTSALPPLHLFLAFCLLSLIGSEQAWCFYFVPVSAHWESWGFACHLCPPHPHPQLTRVRCSLNSCAVNN